MRPCSMRFVAAIGFAFVGSACAPVNQQSLVAAASATRPEAMWVAAPATYEIRLPTRSFVPVAARPDWDELLAKDDAHGVHGLVQLNATPTLDTRAALQQAGITLGQPLTGHAYLALVGPTLDRKAAVLAQIRHAEVYQADDKLSPSLKDERALDWARRSAGRTELVVSLFADADTSDAITRIKALGATIEGEARVAHIVTVSLPAGREHELAGLDAVRYVEPSVPPGREESERARGFIGAAAGAIPAGSPNGQGVIVGVLEGRHAQTTHPDFGGRVTQGDAGTLNFGVHTTMTAGMIAGSGAQSVASGAATANQWRGVAPGASVRTYNYTTSADSITDYIGDVTDAVRNDAVVLMNNSWGDSGCGTLAYGAYVGRAPFLDGVVKGSLGRPVPIVFSAGNERAGFFNSATNANDTSCIANAAAPFENYGTLNHPKAAKNVISVGAIDSGNSAMTSYSSWGPTLDGRIKPDVVAAGHHNGSMNSNVSSITNAFGQPTGAANQQDYRTPIFDTTFVYGWYAQTSSAAAEVTGGQALMIDGWRRSFPGRADPLPSTLRATLVNNAADLDDATTWYNPGPDYASGYGLVRINNSVQSLQRGDAVEGSVAHGGEAHYFLTVPAGAAPLRMTLAWDDEPAIHGANPALVNDLDLVVTDPNGVRRYPWTLNRATPSAAAVRTAEDHVNNLEQVLVDAPAAGAWTIVVRGTTVASGRQDFSLVTPNGFNRQPVDLILALDTSGSMNSVAAPGSLAKIEVLRRSVRLLLETWNLHAIATDRVGITAFSSDVSTTPNTLPALQPFQANFAAVTNAAAGLTASGCTALGGALQTAFNSFDPASSSKRSILVVTDGMQSANPFVGEAGTPARLRIQSFPTSGPLPLDAFYCTTTTANGPSGTSIVPDGQDVAAHNAEIHSIGVGVNGAGFQQVVQRLASENHGISHFTTTPDQNLDVLYINDLIRALKSNTLEVITTDTGTLAAGMPHEISFPVNATSRSVTVVLSWHGVTQANAVSASMRGPSGAIITPAQVRQQGYFTLLRFDLASNTNTVAGTWGLTLMHDSKPALGYQLSVIADESCFHYDVSAPAHLAIGEQLALSASLSEAGRPVQKMNVRALVSAPINSLSNLLAKAVPATRAARKYLAAVQAGQFDKLLSADAVLEAALAELSRNAEFMVEANRYETRALEFKPTSVPGLDPALLGETRFVTGVGQLSRVGAYQVVWQVAGESACGPIQRQELSSILVGIGQIDRERTAISTEFVRRGLLAVRVKPIDLGGNLLGPGQAVRVKIEVDGLRPGSRMIDLLDGTYLRTFVAKGEGEITAKISVGAESWVASGKSVLKPK